MTAVVHEIHRHYRVVALMPLRLILAITVLVAGAGTSASAQTSPCDYDLPAASVPDSFPYGEYGPLRGSDPDLPLGVGHLSWIDGSAEWYRHLVMPMFLEPRGRPFAWFVRGWMVQNGTAEPFGFSGLVETGYEVPSFIVDEQRADGWIRVRYGAPDAHRSAWVPECAFTADSTTVAVETWADRFSSGNTSPLFFRRAVRHALRAAPDAGAELLGWVPADNNAYHIEVQEIRGPWMRVRVVEPSDYCASPGEAQSRRTEGWVRWQDDQVGPWLWYYTRGC